MTAKGLLSSLNQRMNEEEEDNNELLVLKLE